MKPFDVYSVWDIEPVSAEGCFLCDASGNKYLDMYGGHAVISVGHSHPRYIKALETQLKKIGFYSNSVKNGIQDKFAELLGQIAGYEHYSLFMCNSGAEANENALKLASFATGKAKVLAFKGAFHGRTSGAVSITDIPAYSAPFNLSNNVKFVSQDCNEVENELRNGQYCAVIIEGIQGVNGILIPDDDFLTRLKPLTEKYGVKLILDEIQSGCGRTGKYFAHQHAGIHPDIITVAKGIGNGFPVAGVMISPEFVPVKGSLGTTFGGSQLACAAGISVVEIMQDENLIRNAAETGNYLMNELKKMPGIKEIRGRGLMIGIEFDESVVEIRKKLLFDDKIFTGVTSTNIIRLLPPLCLTREEGAVFIRKFSKYV